MTALAFPSNTASEPNPSMEVSNRALLPECPLVSVSMITYNHEQYIAQAIEGVLKQKTSFPVELIIGEDCSTDETRRIVLGYQLNHPELIRVLISSNNVGARENIKRVRLACRGKYIAFCEGDDYWHNPLKLAKQIQEMESDPEAGLVHSDADRYDVEKRYRERSYHKNRRLLCNYGNVVYGLIAMDYFVETCTAVVRKDLLNMIHEECAYEFSANFIMGDVQTWIEIASRKKVLYIDESLATRNLLPESLSRFKDSAKNIRFIINCKLMLFHYADKYGADEARNLKRSIVQHFTPPLFRLAYETSNSMLALEASEEMKEHGVNIAPEHYIYIFGTKSRIARRLTRLLIPAAMPCLQFLRMIKQIFIRTESQIA